MSAQTSRHVAEWGIGIATPEYENIVEWNASYCPAAVCPRHGRRQPNGGKELLDEVKLRAPKSLGVKECPVGMQDEARRRGGPDQQGAPE